MIDKWRIWTAVGAMTLAWAGQAAAVTDADNCQAAKLKTAGKYSFCRLKAEARAVKAGDPVDYSKCDSNYGLKWGTAETNGGGMCPTEGDQTDIQDQITADANLVTLKLTGVHFIDNGDGTVTDVRTGLTWEKKTDDSTVHDKDNVYSWSETLLDPDGTVFLNFLGTLNNGTSSDGTTISGCFAGHCDWRLPTIAELQTILLAPFVCGTSPCIDPIFGATQSDTYWSATTDVDTPDNAWGIHFDEGALLTRSKGASIYVRAVRGGL